MRGYFGLVLHSHLPYVRRGGRWPHGEEMLYEAILDTYLPLIAALEDLAAEGVPFGLTLGITPILAEQLTDPDILAGFEVYLDERLSLAELDARRFDQAGDQVMADLARFWAGHFSQLRARFEAYGRQLVPRLRALAEAGYVELIGGPATHPYLPLLERDSTIYGQLRIRAGLTVSAGGARCRYRRGPAGRLPGHPTRNPGAPAPPEYPSPGAVHRPRRRWVR